MQKKQVKDILLQIDNKFFSCCKYYYDRDRLFSKYAVVVSLPLLYPNMDFVHPDHRKDQHFKIGCRMYQNSFSITDYGYIGQKYQSLGYYGFDVNAFTVLYHKKDLDQRLDTWYKLFRSVLPFLGVK